MDGALGVATLVAAGLTAAARTPAMTAESGLSSTSEETASTAREQALRDVLDELSNPVAGSVSLPFESTWDVDASGDVRYTLELAPVLPLRVSDDWLIVHRVELPMIRNGPLPGDEMSGFGDTEWSALLSPALRWRGWDWGAGFALLLPTAASGLGDDAWSAGPSAAASFQRGTPKGTLAGARDSP